MLKSRSDRPHWRARALALITLLLGVSLSAGSIADETCMSPYMAKIVGQEDFIYVWTVGVEGIGDGEDKLVTIDVHPDSPSYGQVIASLSVGGRFEAHHSGLTDDRRYLWAAGLDTSHIFIFDVHTNPAEPKLVNTIDDFVKATGGVVGPHTNYATPGRMLITGLSNDEDRGGRTALVEYTNAGDYIATYWMPSADDLRGAEQRGKFADGYGYDVRALPRRNALITSSFTGWNNYMTPLGEVMANPDAMAAFGNTVVVWDLHTRQPKTVLDVPGAPLEIRCAWGSNHDYCFTTTALTSKIWLIHADAEGDWSATEVGTISDPSTIPLPVDISIAADDSLLWVNTWNDGTTRAFDISDPFNAKQVYEKKLGAQVNMLSQSWDGERIYYTSSLLAKWDKVEAPEGEDLQYFKAFRWNGEALEPTFAIDFHEAGLGSPHQMRFGAYALYGMERPAGAAASAQVLH